MHPVPLPFLGLGLNLLGKAAFAAFPKAKQSHKIYGLHYGAPVHDVNRRE